MASRRAITRAVAVSSGVVMAGALGMGTASAAVATSPVGNGSDPLGGLSSTVTSTVNATTHATKEATKALGKTGAGLPKPVGKLAKDASKDAKKTVAGVRQTVDKTLAQLTGAGSGSGTPGHKPRHHAGPAGQHRSDNPAGPAATRHRDSGSAAARHDHGSAVPTVGLARLDQYGAGAGGAIPTLPAGHQPSVAQPLAQRPAVASQPGHSLGYDLIHPRAMIPPLRQDTTLQLEMLIVAGALAGVVAGGHALHARRRLRSIRVAAATRTAAAPPARVTSTASSAPPAAPAAPSAKPAAGRGLTRRPGPALG